MVFVNENKLILDVNKFRSWPPRGGQSEGFEYSTVHAKVPKVMGKIDSNVIKNRSSDEDGARAD